MSNKIIILFFISLISIYTFLNLGKFIDITQKAKPADIIVSLGGGNGCRLKKALDLYQNGYSKSKKIIYTYHDNISNTLTQTGSKKKYLLNNGINEENIIHINEDILINTMEEIFFIKKYMIQHQYTSVNFISHPQHSRRITILANYIAEYKKYNLSLTVVSCEPSWWNRTTFYSNKIAFKVTIYETFKLLYNLVKYGTPLIYFTKYKHRIKNNEWDEALQKLN